MDGQSRFARWTADARCGPSTARRQLSRFGCAVKRARSAGENDAVWGRHVFTFEQDDAAHEYEDQGEREPDAVENQPRDYPTRTPM